MFELPPPKDDGLYIPTVGRQSRDKHFFLRKYVDIFTTSMKGKWKGLHYIDLFAGAGIERLRGSPDLAWGSPMIAAYAPKPCDKLHLCDLCIHRLAEEGPDGRRTACEAACPARVIRVGTADEIAAMEGKRLN